MLVTSSRLMQNNVLLIASRREYSDNVICAVSSTNGGSGNASASFVASEKRDFPHFTVAVPFSSMTIETSPSGIFLTISLNNLASSVVFPCSMISPSTEVEIPSSRSFPIRTISFPTAEMRILFNISIVVFPGTAFKTLLTAFANIFFAILIFIIIFSFFYATAFTAAFSFIVFSCFKYPYANERISSVISTLFRP